MQYSQALGQTVKKIVRLCFVRLTDLFFVLFLEPILYNAKQRYISLEICNLFGEFQYVLYLISR